MADLTPERMQELRRIAEAAPPGPWVWREDRRGKILDLFGYSEEIVTPSLFNASLKVKGGFKEYIQAFDPPTVLALLEEIERLRRERDAALDVLGREDIGDGAKVEGVRLILKGGDRGWPTRESERARLVAEVGECCLDADPLCAAR